MNNLNRFKTLKDIELEEGIPVDVLLASWRKYNINLYVNFDNEAGYLKCNYPLDPRIDGKYYSPSNPPQIYEIEDIRNFKYSNTTIAEDLNNCIIEGYASGFWVILPPEDKECSSFILNRWMGLGHYCSEYKQVSRIFAIKNKEDLLEQTCLIDIKNKTNRMNFSFESRDRVIFKKNDLFVNINSIELLANSIISKKEKTTPPPSNFYISNISNISNTLTAYNTLNEYNTYNTSNISNTFSNPSISKEKKSKNDTLTMQEITIKTIIYFLNKNYLNENHSSSKIIANNLNDFYKKLTGKSFKLTGKIINEWLIKENSVRNSRSMSITLYILLYKHCTKEIKENELFEALPKDLKTTLDINKNIISDWIINFKKYNLI